jgi:hypothetical protein
VPFLLLQGEKTAPRYAETFDRFAQCLSRVERVTIPGATHVLPERTQQNSQEQSWTLRQSIEKEAPEVEGRRGPGTTLGGQELLDASFIATG